MPSLAVTRPLSDSHALLLAPLSPPLVQFFLLSALPGCEGLLLRILALQRAVLAAILFLRDGLHDPNQEPKGNLSSFGVASVRYVVTAYRVLKK